MGSWPGGSTSARPISPFFRPSVRHILRRPRFWSCTHRWGGAMAVEWKLVPIQQYKLDRLRESSDSMDDDEVVDEAINRVLFLDEIRALIGDEALEDIL